MAWTRYDPGAGDIGGLSHAASVRRTRAELLRTTTIARLNSVISDAESPSWTAQTATAFVATAQSLLPEVLAIITGLDSDADALDTYAGQVEAIKSDARTLRYRHDELQENINRAVSTLSAPDYSPEVTADEAVVLVHRLGEKQDEMKALERQWDALDTRRRQADGACVAAFDSSASRGKLARLTGSEVSGLSDSQLLARISGLSMIDIAVLFANHPELAKQLAKSGDPAAVAAWWNSYGDPQHPLVPTAAQLALIAAIPGVIGNLNGVNYTSRNLANVVALTAKIASSEKQLAALTAAAAGGGGSGYDTLTPAIAAEQKRLDGLKSIRNALVPDGSVPRQLVTFTSDDPPLAAVSIGNLDTAANVTYTVPGMNTTSADMRGWASAGQNLYNRQGIVDGPASRAVVAWIGYKTPPTPGPENGFDMSVMHGDDARAGAVNFEHDLAGLNAVRAGPPFSLNVVAHSYGTTTASIALADTDLNVRSFVSLGSAGIETSIPNAAAIHADHVYAGQAQNVIPGLEDGQGDQWAWTGRAGSGRADPMDPGFGATTFNTDGVAGDNDLHGVTDHSTNMGDKGFGYLDNHTESLNNAALATTGQGEMVSTYIDPGYTELQQGIIYGAEHPSVY